MGMNTAVLFLNDGLHCLESDPDAGRKIYAGIRAASAAEYRTFTPNEIGFSFGLGNHVNMVAALPCRHADAAQIIAVGGNVIRRIGDIHGAWRDVQSSEKLLKELADQLGYRIVKKAVRHG